MKMIAPNIAMPIVAPIALATLKTPERNRPGGTIGSAARVTTQTADHSAALSESVRRLPGLLSVSNPALRRADEFAVAATPLLENLHASAPRMLCSRGLQ